MKKLLLLTCGLLLWPTTASAHGLGVQWAIKGNEVVLEAFFTGSGAPAQGARVRVFKRQDRDKSLIEVRTNDNGTCSLPLLAPGKYTIAVDAGGGHRKELAMEFAVRPELVPGVALACGLASLGGISNFGMAPLMAQESENNTDIRGDSDSREEYTAYPWNSVLLGVGSIALCALVVWMLRRGTVAG